MHEDLNELSPSEGLDIYLSQREPELRESTIKTVRSRVGMFVTWCEKNDIDRLNGLDGMGLYQYRLETAESVSRRTLACRLSDLRTFLRWARDIEAIDPELPERITVPETNRARTRMLSEEAAQAIREHLRKFSYASRDHVVMLLLWATGARSGAIRSLDVGDFYPDGEYLQFNHRPESDTPLKNGVEGERPVAILPETSLVVSDYLERRREEIRDGFERDPLITTKHGRITLSTHTAL